MRIDFKSLVILSQTTSHFGSTTKTTTVYDMRTVRDHTLEIPAARLLFHPGIFWRVAVFAVLPVTLLLFWTEGAPQDYPRLVAGVLVPWCALFYFLGYMTVKTLEMKRFALRERGLGDQTKLGVVESRHWDSFVAKLKDDPVTARLMDLQGVLKKPNFQDIARQLQERLDERAREAREREAREREARERGSDAT
jgi:hypothetical protein